MFRRTRPAGHGPILSRNGGSGKAGAVRSLADLAFTKTLSWAADSLTPRLRLQAELERLQREISLLREEIRIKDARMEQMEPEMPSQ